MTPTFSCPGTDVAVGFVVAGQGHQFPVLRPDRKLEPRLAPRNTEGLASEDCTTTQPAVRESGDHDGLSRSGCLGSRLPGAGRLADGRAWMLIEAQVSGGNTEKPKLSSAKTVTDKVREIKFAIALEKKYSTDEILSAHLNHRRDQTQAAIPSPDNSPSRAVNSVRQWARFGSGTDGAGARTRGRKRHANAVIKLFSALFPSVAGITPNLLCSA